MDNLKFKNTREINPADLLDIRHLKLTEQTLLKEEITRMVAKTQNPLLVLPLPNILIMTRAQYDLLQTDPDLIGDWSNDDQRMYMTPLNAMDVRILE